MEQKETVSYFKPEKQGVFQVADGWCFSEALEDEEQAGLLLYSKNKTWKIPFSKEGKRGKLYGIRVTAKKFPYESYNYYRGQEVYTDLRAGLLTGLENYGDFENGKRMTRGRLLNETFDWEGDEPLNRPWHETIIYGLNVRTFTKHKDSKVKNKGTFEGIIEKIPYFRELGITAIELMPAYEFDECMEKEATAPKLQQKNRVNLWGYQKGFYYAPKAAYSKKRADLSFKEMVRELHKNQIEVYMQFYFPPDLFEGEIASILKHWVCNYHVDGFRLLGVIPKGLLSKDPFFAETKLRCDYWDCNEIYGEKQPRVKHLAYTGASFRDEIRRFLKGDENLVGQVLYHQRNQPACQAVVNFLADYDGFSLYDMVSYEAKHNEANGEDNKDGTDQNYSWNCGCEGETRKKSVLELRKSQIKNGLTLLFLSQGVPYLFAGDEFACTRNGNNNAYCLDNPDGYVKWKLTKFSEEILEFTKGLIALRKDHPILHMSSEFKLMDQKGCGFPDLSYHGTEPWKPDLSYVSRMVGIMMSGEYAGDHSFYLAMNMHWQSHELALPRLPEAQKWRPLFATAKEEKTKEKESIRIAGRSCILYESMETL